MWSGSWNILAPCTRNAKLLFVVCVRASLENCMDVAVLTALSLRLIPRASGQLAKVLLKKIVITCDYKFVFLTFVVAEPRSLLCFCTAFCADPRTPRNAALL